MPPTAEPPPVDAGKVAWRRWWRGVRSPVPDEVSAGVVVHLRAVLDGVAGIVAVYDALPTEVDVGALVAGAPERFALPITGDDGTLSFRSAAAPRAVGRWGFSEPSAEAPVIDPADLGAVCVPCELVDRRGVRLGHGGGHYDRFLASIDPAVPRIGVLAAAGLVDRLPADHHDVRLTRLVTEHGPLDLPDMGGG